MADQPRREQSLPGAPAGVRPVEPDDIADLGKCLARAFDEDPISVYLFPSRKTRARRLERFFRWQLKEVFLPKGEAWTTDDLAGASLWMPPNRRPLGVFEGLGQLAAVTIMLGRRTGRAIRLLEALEARHPKLLHCYLGTIGTDPSRQRSGVGSALMTVVLDRLDDQAIPAYLESSKEENLAFYHRHGFVVTGEIQASGAAPRLWLMWREPRPRGDIGTDSSSSGRTHPAGPVNPEAPEA